MRKKIKGASKKEIIKYSIIKYIRFCKKIQEEKKNDELLLPKT